MIHDKIDIIRRNQKSPTTTCVFDKLTSWFVGVIKLAFPLLIVWEILKSRHMSTFDFHGVERIRLYEKNSMHCPGFGTMTTTEDVPMIVHDAAQWESMGLRAIVTGIEHSGTTLTGALLYNAPCVIGAFETGFLLATTPQTFDMVQPWFRWNNASNDVLDLNYRLHPDDVAAMKSASNFMDMYDVLRRRSYLFNDLNDGGNCTKPYQMVDKTPLYVYPNNFETILKRTPGVPVIVTKKNYEKLKESWDRRNSTPPKPYTSFQNFYHATFNNVCKMMDKYPNRIIIIQEEELMSNPNTVMKLVFDHVGLVWKSEYLNMTGLLKKLVNDTRTSTQIEQSYVFKAGKHSFDRTDGR